MRFRPLFSLGSGRAVTPGGARISRAAQTMMRGRQPTRAKASTWQWKFGLADVAWLGLALRSEAEGQPIGLRLASRMAGERRLMKKRRAATGAPEFWIWQRPLKAGLLPLRIDLGQSMAERIGPCSSMRDGHRRGNPAPRTAHDEERKVLGPPTSVVRHVVEWACRCRHS